jgi:hypothetical protein
VLLMWWEGEQALCVVEEGAVPLVPSCYSDDMAAACSVPAADAPLPCLPRRQWRGRLLLAPEAEPVKGYIPVLAHTRQVLEGSNRLLLP